MKKVFLAAPFKSLVNSKTMSMDEEKKNAACAAEASSREVEKEWH